MTRAQVTFPDGYSFQVEVATTQEERSRGLSYRSECGNGMLFVFPDDGIVYRPMWMWRMRFPLDIVWLDARGMIVDAAMNVPPGPNDGPCLPVVNSMIPAVRVLELPAGSIVAHGLTVGSIVVIR
jgi:hypothetical protein